MCYLYGDVTKALAKDQLPALTMSPESRLLQVQVQVHFDHLLVLHIAKGLIDYKLVFADSIPVFVRPYRGPGFTKTAAQCPVQSDIDSVLIIGL